MEEHSITEAVVHFTLQIGIILLFAKALGGIFKKLGQSPVLGELIAGMIIGPFALGKIELPWLGAIFPLHHGNIPVSTELYVFAQIGAILLLFLVGLETDAKMFAKYGVKALGIAIGGVIAPFFLGAWGTTLFGFADSIFDGSAMFMGAIMTATSVGITARVLSDIYKLDTDEGVSILAAAVIDDVLGILTLALVISLAGGEGGGEGFDWGALGMIALKALGFIAVVLVVGLALGKRLSKLLLKLEGKTYMVVAAAICFIIAALAEKFGLAMIIGAYMTGLILSVTEVGKQVEEKLTWASNLIVPVFFAVMGMLVNFSAMKSVLVFGLVISAFAVISKVFGCGIPALFSGFNRIGAFRIGIGMLPRGEVALIVAGIGLAAGIVSQEIFGVSIMMTLITTILAPLILVPIFKTGGSGLKKPKVCKVDEEIEPMKPEEMIEPLLTWKGSENLLSEYVDTLTAKLNEEGYDLIHEDSDRGIYELKHGDDQTKAMTLKRLDKKLTLDSANCAAADAKRVSEEAREELNQKVIEFKPIAEKTETSESEA